MRILDAAGALLGAMHAEFVDGHTDTDDDPVPHLVMQPGTLAVADWCSEQLCWQVWGRTDAIYPSRRFPIPDTDPAGTQGPMAVRFQWGTFRCVHTMDADGQPPDPADQTNDAMLLLDDADRVRCALAAAAKQWPASYVQLGTWVPLAQQGGCAGGYWPITVWLHGQLKAVS